MPAPAAADFLAENSICGQALLGIVSQGNAIHAELSQLRDFVPSVFRKGTKENAKFEGVLCDFGYFQSSDTFEANLEKNKALGELDAQFRSNYQSIISRFYLLLEAVHRYVANLRNFLDDLESGTFVQQSIETLMDHDEARQLMCEALWLYGTMLLLIDIYIDGEAREQLLVSYYRQSADSSDSSTVDDVCKLFRSTGLFPGKKRPNGYPEEYFARETLPHNYIDHVIGRLRSADVYNQTSAYPHPEHHTSALQTQAGMLTICLFFAPEYLHHQAAKMRETVDRFLPDNWVVPVHMGLCLNLVEWWQPYAAARGALANTTELGSVKMCAKKHSDALQRLTQQTRVDLCERMYSSDYLLEHSNKVFRTLRECNVTLKWLTTHVLTESKIGENPKSVQKLRDVILTNKISSEMILELILNTAELELKVKETLENLLDNKGENLDTFKKECQASFAELSEVYSGTKPLTKLEKNEKLAKWFVDMSKQLDELNVEDTAGSSRRLAQILRAIEEVQELSQVESHPHIRQYMIDIQSIIRQMIRLIGLSDRQIITLQMISDFSYAWGDHIGHFVPKMQALAKKDPGVIARLRATFLKLSTAMEQPLLRVNQAQSDDLVSMSTFYSKELEVLIRKVLYVIPETMIALLEEIIQIQTGLKELPTRLDRDQQKEFSQLDERFKIAQLTHRVSQLSAGVLAMKSTLIGVINLDPRRLLEDGIRRELVRQIATILHKTLVFGPKFRNREIYEKMHDLVDAMNCLRRSFEYIQDYIGFHGLKIVNEELTRVLCFLLEQETNSFQKVHIQDWQSKYQSRAIPIPRLPPIDNNSVTAIGRFVRELVRITDPKSTLFLESETTWFDQKTHSKVLEMKIFEMMQDAISTVGVCGVIKLMSCMIEQNFGELKRRLESLSSDRGWKEIELVVRSSNTEEGIIEQPSRHFGNLVGKASSHLQGLSDLVSSIGQLQLLQSCANLQLNLNARYNAKNLVSALESLETGVINDMRHKTDVTLPFGNELNEVNELLQRCGMTDSLYARYSFLNDYKEIPYVLALLVLALLPRFSYSKPLGALIARRPGDMDGYPFLTGLKTLLRHSGDLEVHFYSILKQFVTSNICSAQYSRSSDLPSEVVACAATMRLLSRMDQEDYLAEILSIPQISVHL